MTAGGGRQTGYMQPTDEQLDAIEAYRTGENLRIEALAGTGKTTTLTLLVRQGSPRGGKILYTAFGKKVIQDAKAKFPRGVQVRTNHSLAWPLGKTFEAAGRLQGRLSPQDYIRHFGWGASAFPATVDVRSGAYAVIETVNTFCQSGDDRISTSHSYGPVMRLARGDKALAQQLAGLIASYAMEAWEQTIPAESRLPVTHDIYLKLWALRDPYIPATTILLDEAQDANGVMIGVLQRQTHAQLVVVGDRQQQIFAWRGAVDAMDAFEFAHSTTLTRSFRFGPEIAEVASAILEDQCGRDLYVSGDPEQAGVVGPCDLPHCYLARTNAVLIGQAYELAMTYPAYKIGVVGGVDDLIKLVEGAAALQVGERTQVPDLAEFDHWRDVQEAAKHEAYGHLRTLVQLVDDFGTPTLRTVLERMRGNEADPDSCDALLSTAHKSKGAEFSSVRLLDDFKPKGPPEDVGRYGWTPDEGNLLYVACTRARHHLDISNCEAVLASLPPGFAMTYPPAPVPQWDGEQGDDEAEEPDLSDPVNWRREAVEVPLREGRYAHPLIDGGLVHIEMRGDGARVVVSAQGFTLVDTEGDVRVINRERHWVDVCVGSAQLPMPFDCVIEG